MFLCFVLFHVINILFTLSVSINIEFYKKMYKIVHNLKIYTTEVKIEKLGIEWILGNLLYNLIFYSGYCSAYFSVFNKNLN